MKCGFFSKKKHIKFGRMIKSASLEIYSIACYTFSPSFAQFANTTPVKLFPFCCESLIESFFHIFVRTKALLSKCVTHLCKQVIIGRSQVWWVSDTGWNFPTEFFQRDVYQFIHMWWRIVRKEIDYVLPHLVRPLSDLFSSSRTVQIGQLLLITFSTNRFPKF